MKNRIVASILLGAIACGGSAFAKEYSYPVEKPIFSIDIPDAWEVALNSDEVAINATSPDEEIEYYIWPLPASALKADPKAAFMEAAKEADDLIKEYVKDSKFGEPQEKKINGIDSLWLEGSGKYKDGGKAVNVKVGFFSPDDKAVYILMYWGTKDGEEKLKAEIEKIDNSIKKAQ